MTDSQALAASTFSDPRLGEFQATREERKKLGNGVTLVWRNWAGRCLVPGQTTTVSLSLSGDEAGPQSGLLVAVQAVFDNLGPIAQRAAAELVRRGASATPSDFRLSSICDWDQHDEVLQVEYLPLRAGLVESDVELYWPGDDWGLDHHIVLRSLDYGALAR